MSRTVIALHHLPDREVKALFGKLLDRLGLQIEMTSTLVIGEAGRSWTDYEYFVEPASESYESYTGGKEL